MSTLQHPHLLSRPAPDAAPTGSYRWLVAGAGSLLLSCVVLVRAEFGTTATLAIGILFLIARPGSQQRADSDSVLRQRLLATLSERALEEQRARERRAARTQGVWMCVVILLMWAAAGGLAYAFRQDAPTPILGALVLAFIAGLFPFLAGCYQAITGNSLEGNQPPIQNKRPPSLTGSGERLLR